MSLFSCSPMETKVQGEKQLEEGRKKVTEDTSHLQLCSILSSFFFFFLHLVCPYTLKTVFFSKHIFDYVGLLWIPQDHQLHFMISERTDVFEA